MYGGSTKQVYYLNENSQSYATKALVIADLIVAKVTEETHTHKILFP